MGSWISYIPFNLSREIFHFLMHFINRYPCVLDEKRGLRVALSKKKVDPGGLKHYLWAGKMKEIQ